MTDVPVHAPPTAGSGHRGTRPIWVVLGGVVMAVMIVALAIVATRGSGPAHSSQVFEYTVAPGTSARIEAGERLYIFPSHLDARVGDQLVIHNNDTRVVEVGPYTIDRNATLQQTFTHPGTIIGICTIHPSGRVTIDVRA
jgi:hypothetical protein